MTEALSTEKTTIRPETLMAELGIKKSKYYQVLKELRITAKKDLNKKAYLTNDQAQRIREFFNSSYSPQSEVSSSSSLPTEGANNSSLVKDADSNLGSSSNGSLVKTSEGELSKPANQENIYVKPDEPTAGFNVGELMRGAAELKARELAMGDLVKRSLADKMAWDDLPPDLQQSVREAHEAANPNFLPGDLAQQLLNQHRNQEAVV